MIPTLGITLQELEKLMEDNPSLRGYVTGYVAEAVFARQYLQDDRIQDLGKPADHNRNEKYDRLFSYRGKKFRLESKLVKTASLKETEDGWMGKAQCDASDCRLITLPNGKQIKTTALLRNSFDILAVSFRDPKTHIWHFGFIRNEDLPPSSYQTYTAYERKHLLATTIAITYPWKKPFYDDLFELLDDLVGSCTQA